MLGSLEKVSGRTENIGQVGQMNELVADLTSDPNQNTPAARVRIMTTSIIMDTALICLFPIFT